MIVVASVSIGILVRRSVNRPILTGRRIDAEIKPDQGLGLSSLA